jgi:hypothetical protein
MISISAVRKKMVRFTEWIPSSTEGKDICADSYKFPPYLLSEELWRSVAMVVKAYLPESWLMCWRV